MLYGWKLPKRRIRGEEWEKQAADKKWKAEELLVFCHATVFSAVGTLQSVFLSIFSYFLFVILFLSFFSFEYQLARLQNPFIAVLQVSLLWGRHRQTDRHLQADKRTDWVPALLDGNGLYILCYCFLNE